jgi:hypothetical protein
VSLYAIIAAALLAIGGFLGYHFTAKHYETVIAANAAAVQKAVEAQVALDAKASQNAEDRLNDEIATLRAAALSPAPSVRCAVASRVPKVLPSAGVAGEPATSGGSVPEVSNGTALGPDIGAGLQQLAQAGDIVSAVSRACLGWASAVSK